MLYKVFKSDYLCSFDRSVDLWAAATATLSTETYFFFGAYLKLSAGFRIDPAGTKVIDSIKHRKNNF